MGQAQSKSQFLASYEPADNSAAFSLGFVLGQTNAYIEQVTNGAKLAAQLGCGRNHLQEVLSAVHEQNCDAIVEDREHGRVAVWIYRLPFVRSLIEKDPYTQGHCERLADYSARLGEHMGLPAEKIKALRRAGIVHDIGKVAVPDSILLKPSRLTCSEQMILRLHPVVGERICASLKSFQLVLPIIRHHHEKMDGSGYPDGLKGEQIPLTARVLQIVDVYDALSNERPYKPALSTAAALGIMKNEVKKGWWDPKVWAAFEELMKAEEGKAQPNALAAATR